MKRIFARHFYVWTLLGVFLALPSVALAKSANPANTIEVDPPLGNNAEVGYGYSFDTSDLTPKVCVTGTPYQSASSGVVTTIGEYSDNTTLSEAFDLSAHAQASFLFASASAEASYALKQVRHEQSQSVAVRSNIVQWRSLVPADSLAKLRQFTMPKTSSGSLVVTSPAYVGDLVNRDKEIRLTDDAVELLKRDTKDFWTRCGQGFVSDIAAGADVVGFFTERDASSEDDETIKASLSGNYLGVSASGSASDVISKLYSQSGSTLQFLQFGGSFTTQPSNAQGLITQIQNLPGTIQDFKSQEQFHLYVKLYGPDSVANWPSNIDPPNEDASVTLDQIITRYWLMSSLYDDADTIERNQGNYILGWGVDANTVSRVKDVAMQAALDLKRAAATCFSSRKRGQSCNASVPTVQGFDDQYYALLAQLPLPNGWNAEYTQLHSVYARARNVVDSYQGQAYAWIQWCQGPGGCMHPNDDPTCYYRNHAFHGGFSDNYYSSQMQPAISALESADDAFAQSLRRDIPELRLRDTARWRCGTGFDGVGCVSDAQVAAYASAVPVVEHSIATNTIPENGNHIYDDCNGGNVATLSFQI